MDRGYIIITRRRATLVLFLLPSRSYTNCRGINENELKLMLSSLYTIGKIVVPQIAKHTLDGVFAHASEKHGRSSDKGYGG